jgi:RNA polymerase sigma-70 factor (ECF subfamily)
VSTRCNARVFPGFILLVNHAVELADIAPGWRWLQSLSSAPEDEAGVAPDDPDGAVFLRAARGDEQAWQQLFEGWKKPLLAFFYRSLGSMPDAEDLALEVFVRLHRAAGRYEPSAKFSTYLFHIARNLLRNELRRRRRKPAQPVAPEAFDYVASPDAAAAADVAGLEEAFQDALTRLPEADRSLLLLVHQQGLAPSDAAGLVGLTANAVRVQLHRARQRLKNLMSSHP